MGLKELFLQGVKWISRVLPDKIYLYFLFKKRMGKQLSFKNPKTFSEKLQWLKIYDRKNEYIGMVDKYMAKDYIAQQIGEEYVVPTIGVWSSVDEIDFNKLPDKFVIKCTHDNGSVILCKDKKTLNVEDVKKVLKKSMKRNFFYVAREWPYKNIKPRIMVEKFMEESDVKTKNIETIDYKFYCFNGVPRFLYVSQGLDDHNRGKINYMTMEWQKCEFHRTDYKEFDVIPPKPVNFEKMKELASILSKDTIFLRVDFYEIDKRIYFSELTFFPGAGMTRFEPEEWDYKVGEMLKLPL